MPFNAAIPLSIQGVKLPDPMANAMRMAQIQNAQTQNALAQYKMKEAERETSVRNALNKGYAEAYDPNTQQLDRNGFLNYLAQNNLGSQIPTVSKSLDDADLSFNKAVGERLKLSRLGLENVNDPEGYLNWIVGNYKDPVLGRYFQSKGASLEGALRQAQKSFMTPGGFEEALRVSKIGNEKALEDHYVSQNLGGSTVIKRIINGQANVVPGSEEIITRSPNAPQVKVDLSRTAESEYSKTLGTGIGTEDLGLRTVALKAPELAASADRVIDTLDNGNVFTGTGANVKLQIAKGLKLLGADDNESIANTELVISDLAKNTMGAIKSSGLGSAQGFTDKDLLFLKQATAGDITYDDKTLRRLAELSHRAAESSVQKWNDRVKKMPASAVKGTNLSTEPIVINSRSNKQSREPQIEHEVDF